MTHPDVSPAAHPVTADQIVADLQALGLRSGATVLIHCALSSLGTVPGGEQAVLMALREVVGESGTVVVPTQSWQLCDPAYLNDPTVPRDSWEAVRASLPAYDRRWTPSRSVGLLAEAVRTHPSALRSGHPHRSFSAWGPAAGAIVAEHQLDDPVGEGSPLATLYNLGAVVLLLGVGFAKCTALHLAESRSGVAVQRVPNGAPMMIDGQRSWVEFTEPAVDDSDFAEIGLAFANSAPTRVTVGRVGLAESRLFGMRELVDFAADWMGSSRRPR